jgi:hypothetical protein
MSISVLWYALFRTIVVPFPHYKKVTIHRIKKESQPLGWDWSLFVCEALRLLADEFGIVEIVDTHGFTDLIHGLSPDFTSLLRTFL